MGPQPPPDETVQRQKTQQRAAVDVLQSIERQLIASAVARKPRHPIADFVNRLLWLVYIPFAALIGLSCLAGAPPPSAAAVLIAGYTILRALDRGLQ
jgi:hypothetical protein